MRAFLTALMLISLLALTASAQNNSANTNQTGNTVTIDSNNRPTEPIRLEISSAKEQNSAVDFLGKVAAPLSVLVAVILGIIEVIRNRELRNDELTQKQIELKWKKADLAKTVLNEMHTDPYAVDAMAMIDWGLRDYDVKTSRGARSSVEEISSRDVWAALRITEKHFNNKETYIRDCFDHFFGVMQTLQHYIEIKLIEPADVKHPFNYYANEMKEGHRNYAYFINKYYEKAGKFLTKNTGWAKLKSEDNSGRAFFMFDCPPGNERFVFMLTDPAKIARAREEILSGKVELHVTGTLVSGGDFYNQPWSFHLDPASVDFVEDSSEFSDDINKLVEAELPRPKATFRTNDIWHSGGARLLAEIPESALYSDRYEARIMGMKQLERQGRLAAPAAPTEARPNPIEKEE